MAENGDEDSFPMGAQSGIADAMAAVPMTGMRSPHHTHSQTHPHSHMYKHAHSHTHDPHSHSHVPACVGPTAVNTEYDASMYHDDVDDGEDDYYAGGGRLRIKREPVCSAEQQW